MLEFKSRRLVAPTPTKSNKTAVNLYLSIDTRDKIDRLAKENGFRDRSQFITEMVKLIDDA